MDWGLGVNFFRRIIIALLFLELFAVFSPEAFAEPPQESKTAQDLIEGKLRTPQDREAALPPVVEINKPKASIDDAFGKQYVSNKVTTSFPGRIISGSDITNFELDEMTKILKGQKGALFEFDSKIPSSQRFLINERYHPGDLRLPPVFQLAMDKKIGLIGQISHLDDALYVKDFQGNKRLQQLNDKTVKPAKNANGQVITELKKMGFGYATDGVLPDHFIAGPPILDKKGDERNDLYHQKGWLVGERDEKGNVIRAFTFPGTANEVPHGKNSSKKSDSVSTRYNRAFTVLDPDLAIYHAQTAIRNAEQFASATNIKKLENDHRLRVNFKDGFVEEGFTHGANNMNARWTAILLHAVHVRGSDGKMRPLTQAEVDAGFDVDVSSAFKDYKKYSGWTPTEYWASDFVETHTPSMLKAEKMLYEQYPHLQGGSGGDNKKIGNSFKLVDAKFATDPTGWGLITPQNGVSLQREMGGTVFPWPERIHPDTYVYIRGTGEKETDQEGPPVARYLQHDKTGGTAGTLNGKPIAFMRNGSFNYSNAEGNAEEQKIFGGLDPESWIYKGTRESVQSIIKNETKYAIPFKEAMRMADVARMTGRGLLEVDRKLAGEISEHLDFGEFEQAKAKLLKLAKKPTDLDEKVPFKELEKRIENMVKYMTWHFENYNHLYGKKDGDKVTHEPGYPLIRFANVTVLLSKKDLTPANAAFELRGLVLFPNGDDAEIEKRAAEAWKLLGFAGEIPPKFHKDGDGPAPGSKVAEPVVNEEEPRGKAPKKTTRSTAARAATTRTAIGATSQERAAARANAKAADCAKGNGKLAPKGRRTAKK